jgi:RNase P subunit RPR2
MPITGERNNNMGWRTVPICDPCWVEQEGSRSPVRLVDTSKEYVIDTCYKCHGITRGIYTRALIEGAVTTPDDAA